MSWRRDHILAPATPGMADWFRALGLFLAAGLLIEFTPIDLAPLAVSAAAPMAGHGFFGRRRWIEGQWARVAG